MYKHIKYRKICLLYIAINVVSLFSSMRLYRSSSLIKLRFKGRIIGPTVLETLDISCQGWKKKRKRFYIEIRAQLFAPNY